MTTLTEIRKRITGTARAQASRYAHGDERPLGGYAVTMGVYGGTLAVLAAAVRLSGRDLPSGLSPGDITLCAASTHKLSRLLAKDPVTSPFRAPFTSYRGTEGPAELDEEVRGHGARKTVGELVTCPFCLSMWLSTGLVAGLILLPKPTRIAMGGLTALAGADMLQFAHAWLDKAASG
jgi:hypothetical protein